MIKRNTSQICLWVGMVLMLAVSTKASTQDPGTWSQTGDLNFAREHHTATLLPNGQVLVAGGGMYSSTSELYDPATGTWTQTGNLNVGRGGHTATLLPNSKVLVTGGYTGIISSDLVQSELYDPATETWTQTGNLNFKRSGHTATLLPNGKVLVAGGSFSIPTDCDKWGCRSSIAYYPVQSELYDSATGTWIQTGNLNVGRGGHTATLLPNGKVLMAGGFGGGTTLINRSCTILPPGHGPKPAIPTTTDILIRQPCCPMARCWWRGGAAVLFLFCLFNRSCTTLPAGLGPKPAISTLPDLLIRQPCCPVARCW